jgi:hypothetical protein
MKIQEFSNYNHLFLDLLYFRGYFKMIVGEIDDEKKYLISNIKIYYVGEEKIFDGKFKLK